MRRWKGPILATIVQTPRAEVVDEAETILTALGRESSTLLRQLVDLVPRTASPTARAALVQSLAGVRDQTAKLAIEVALNDEAPEVRDAAASALARFGALDALPALQRRLRRERNAVVLSSLRAALRNWRTPDGDFSWGSSYASRSRRSGRGALPTLRGEKEPFSRSDVGKRTPTASPCSRRKMTPSARSWSRQ